MSTTLRPRRGRRGTYCPAPGGSPFRMLVSAESHRARQTRSTLVIMAVVVGIALVMLTVRVILSGTSDTSLGPETITLSADIVGFAVLLTSAMMVARDHQAGTIDLLRVLAPARARHLAARATGSGIVALLAVGVVISAGLLAVLILNPAALGLDVVDTAARTAVTTFFLAWTGVGIGALTRSTAAATFIVIALYWLLPIVLVIAGLSGADWANPASEATLGFLNSNAIAPGPEHWAATGGTALWATASILLGILRETKGN